MFDQLVLEAHAFLFLDIEIVPRPPKDAASLSECLKVANTHHALVAALVVGRIALAPDVLARELWGLKVPPEGIGDEL